MKASEATNHPQLRYGCFDRLGQETKERPDRFVIGKKGTKGHDGKAFMSPNSKSRKWSKRSVFGYDVESLEPVVSQLTIDCLSKEATGSECVV